MLRRVFFLCGLVAALLYVAVVVAGGIMRPGYDHLSMAVSELIAAGAPQKSLLDALFIVYNGLLIVFAWAAGMSIRGDGKGTAVAGAALLAAVGLLGLLMTLFFPMDPRGSAATITGTMHLAFAGALSLCTVLSILFLTLGARDHDAFWVYSLVSCALVVLTGAFAAVTAALASPVLGLAERLTIFFFLQWVAGFSGRLVKEDLGR